MASLPHPNRVTYEEWLQMPEVDDAPEVWVVSRKDRVIEVFHLEKNALERAAIVTSGVLKPRAFPHVEIDIARIWPD